MKRIALASLLVAALACEHEAPSSMTIQTPGTAGAGAGTTGAAAGTTGASAGTTGAAGATTTPATGGSDAGAPSGGVTGTAGASGGATGMAGATAKPDGGASDVGSAGGAGSLGTSGAPAGSPVALHGTLKTQGNRVVGADGKPVQLKGMSLYWSQFAAGSAFYNAGVVNTLAKDWHASIVRIAIAATGDNDGDYLQKPAEQLALLDTVMQACFANGVYALVDWHDHHAPMHLDAAKTFFDTVSKKYGGRANTIYEIWNEPRGNEGLTWTGDLKPYAETIAKVIRANDAKNLIVAGTPFWDQQPSAVLGNPVADTNVAYTLHFYAGYQPHFFGGDLGKNAQMAVAGGLPLFVTEWGTTDPLTQTMFNEAETRKWMAFLDANFISSCNWSISGANEGSSALKPGASTTGGWPDAMLSPSGLLVRNIIRGN